MKFSPKENNLYNNFYEHENYNLLESEVTNNKQMRDFIKFLLGPYTVYVVFKRW